MNTEVFEMYRRPQPLVLPELVSLGTFATSESRIGGPRKDGHDGLEVGFLEDGSIEWWTESGLDEAGPGSIIIDWPGDWQGGSNAIVHPCRRYWVRFNFPPTGSLPGLADRTVAALDMIYSSMQARHFPASPSIKKPFQQLIDLQRNPRDFAEEISRALFHQILFTVAHDYHANQQAGHSAPIAAALRFFESNRHRDLRVEEVAAEARLSVGYFYELFLREVGVTPSQYHLRVRVAAAKRELAYTDDTITAISMDLGFSSSQYFATAFKKVVGLTPRQYRTLRWERAATREQAKRPPLPHVVHPGSGRQTPIAPTGKKPLPQRRAAV